MATIAELTADTPLEQRHIVCGQEVKFQYSSRLGTWHAVVRCGYSYYSYKGPSIEALVGNINFDLSRVGQRHFSRAGGKPPMRGRK